MKKVFALVLCLMLLVPMVVGCTKTTTPTTSTAPATSTAPTTTSGTKDTIYLGLAIPLTGTGAEGGGKMKFSAELAVQQLNDKGGINGHPVELVVLDDAQDATQAATVAQTLCDDKRITAVIAHSASAISAVTQPIFEENKMPNIHPSSSVDKLSTYGYEYFWRNTGNSSSTYPNLAAILGNTLKVKKIALIYQNAETGAELDKYAKTLEKAGTFQIVLDEPFNSGTQVDFSTLITKLMATDAEAVWLYANYTEGGTFLKQMLDMGCKLPVVSSNWLTYQTTVDLAGAAGCANLYCAGYPSPFGTSDVAKAYLKAFEGKFGTGAIPNGPAMNTYDAVLIIAQAMEQGATKENLAQWCKNLNGLHEGKTFTASGLLAGDNVQWSKNGEVSEPAYSIIRVDKDGHFYEAGKVDLTGFKK